MSSKFGGTEAAMQIQLKPTYYGWCSQNQGSKIANYILILIDYVHVSKFGGSEVAKQIQFYSILRWG